MLLLAGLLIVNKGEAPGRPLGARPEFIVGRRAAAGSKITFNVLLKEIAMKTSIITALFVVGLLLQLAILPTIGNSSAATTTSQHRATLQTPTAAEMNAAVGAGLTGCFQVKAANGDVYETCCVDLWLFAICASVNITAIERLVSSVLPF